MPDLVTVQIATEILGNTKTSLYVSACVYRKRNGVYPSWFISNGQRGARRSWVDIDVLLKYRQDELDAYNYGTNELWWELMDIYNANKLAAVVSRRSTLYPTFTVWRAFFTKYLFTEPCRVKLTDKITMRQEFVIIGKQILEEHNHEGNIETWETLATA